jgi:UDP-N-acetylbacillosamine N-acetyltransferase
LINKLIIIGAGGHGKVAADCAEASRLFGSIVFLDDEFPAMRHVAHWPVIGTPEQALQKTDSDTLFFVAIGDNHTRTRVTLDIQRQHLSLAKLIHPSAVISPHAVIGLGTLVCAHATVNIATTIGQGCIINTASSIDHDCNIGDFVHIAPGSRLAGIVSVGARSFLGIASAVIQGRTIGNNSILGAGSTLLDDLGDSVVAVGSPAKIIKTITK